MANVNWQRPEVTAKAASWKLVRDAVAGSEAVKAGGYLPLVNAFDESAENKARNRDRLARAVYVNATGRTLSALVGVAFGKWPEVEVPGALDYVMEDIDGSGVGIVNQSQLVVADVLQTGRAGLLVDYPANDGVTSRAQQDAGSLRATVALYAADSIINWRTEKVGSEHLLALVVLAETVEEWDGYERKEVPQWRELALEDGRYVQRVWQEADSGMVVVEERWPVNGAGQPWRRIPFTFIGATNNDPAPDKAPLYDLADLNIAHFRNSADHEESLFFAGQAQVWVTGADAHWLKEMQDAGIYVGSRAIGVAPQGGDVKLIQAAPVSALAEEMARKVELMAALGARLIQPGTVAKTATESAGDDKAAHSVLSLVCDNVSDAYRAALKWAAEFMRADGEVEFTIGTEFAGVQFDAQQMAQALAAVQGGKLPESDFWTYCRSIGLIDATKDDDAIRDELETQG
ncbi:MAG: DUF4055 domain-containing protein, partial [Gammaproteobacteria bacterium]|nr:DUF4055 domain-containing protein [Gammaproteobacteria bacterium]